MSSSVLDRNDPQQEATSMNEFGQHTDTIGNGSPAICSNVTMTQILQGRRAQSHRESAIQAFWRRQVSATVAHDACRDHFGV